MLEIYYFKRKRASGNKNVIFPRCGSKVRQTEEKKFAITTQKLVVRLKLIDENRNLIFRRIWEATRLTREM